MFTWDIIIFFKNSRINLMYGKDIYMNGQDILSNKMNKFIK